MPRNEAKDHFRDSENWPSILEVIRRLLRHLLGGESVFPGLYNCMSSARCSNRGIYKLPALLFLVIFHSSCVATQQDLLYLNDQLAALDSRLNRLEASLSQQLSVQIDAQLRSIRNTQAELVAENQEIRGEIRDLSGRVEEITHWIENGVEKDAVEQDTGEVSLSQLETEVNYVLEYLDIEMPQRLEKEYIKKDSRGDRALRNQTLIDEEGVDNSETQLYEKALDAYKVAQYERALSRFGDFLKKYPDSDLADDAGYRTGLCHMALQQYEQAVIAYQELINKSPKNNKVPGAMLRQAIAFQEIGDHTAARIVLKRIIKQYQNSIEARIAEEKLKTQLTKSRSLPASTEDSTTKIKARYHVVRRGDSLYRIAQKYAVSVKKIRRLNNLAKEQFIYPGQKLLIKQETSN